MEVAEVVLVSSLIATQLFNFGSSFLNKRADDIKPTVETMYKIYYESESPINNYYENYNNYYLSIKNEGLALKLIDQQNSDQLQVNTSIITQSTIDSRKEYLSTLINIHNNLFELAKISENNNTSDNLLELVIVLAGDKDNAGLFNKMLKEYKEGGNINTIINSFDEGKDKKDQFKTKIDQKIKPYIENEANVIKALNSFSGFIKSIEDNNKKKRSKKIILKYLYGTFEYLEDGQLKEITYQELISKLVNLFKNDIEILTNVQSYNFQHSINVRQSCLSNATQYSLLYEYSLSKNLEPLEEKMNRLIESLINDYKNGLSKEAIEKKYKNEFIGNLSFRTYISENYASCQARQTNFKKCIGKYLMKEQLSHVINLQYKSICSSFGYRFNGFKKPIKYYKADLSSIELDTEIKRLKLREFENKKIVDQVNKLEQLKKSISAIKTIVINLDLTLSQIKNYLNTKKKKKDTKNLEGKLSAILENTRSNTEKALSIFNYTYPFIGEELK